jgi:bacterioferritin-associated ferredoxin
MIVCVCNVLREKDCRDAAAAPDVRGTACVYRRLNCRVRCGACVATMKSIVDELREERAARQEPATTQPMVEPAAEPLLDAEALAAE